MLKRKIEAYLIKNEIENLETNWDYFLNYIKKHNDLVLEELKNNGVFIFGARINTKTYTKNNEESKNETVQIYIIVYDSNNVYDAINTLNSENLYSSDLTSTNGVSYKKNGENVIQIHIPVKIETIKRGRYSGKEYIKYPENYEKKYLNTLKHEFNHQYEELSGLDKSTTTFSGVISDNLDIFNSLGNKYDLMCVLSLLYKYWNTYEFNAHLLNLDDYYVSTMNDLRKFKPEVNYNDLDALNKNNNEKFWGAVKILVSNGISNKSESEKIKNMKSMEFKSFFIKKTKYLMDKFVKKYQKNLYQDLTEREEKERIYDEILNGLRLAAGGNKNNITKNPLTVKLPIKFYSKNNSSSLDANIKIITSFNGKSVSELSEWLFNKISMKLYIVQLKREIDIPVDEKVIKELLVELISKRLSKLENYAKYILNATYPIIKNI